MTENNTYVFWHRAGEKKQLKSLLHTIGLGSLVSILMYYFAKSWYADYDTMLKHDDGEWRDDNDYSSETVEAKMKFYWLFDW